MTTKLCFRCKINKPLEEYYSDSSKKDGKSPTCKSCRKLTTKNTWTECSSCGEEFIKSSKNKRCTKCSSDAHRKNKFNISPEQYNKLLEKQNGVCSICKQIEKKINKNGKPKALAVDHDHKTGQIRGLLCHNCNVAIGFLRDSPILSASVSQYLKESWKQQGIREINILILPGEDPIINMDELASWEMEAVLMRTLEIVNEYGDEIIKNGFYIGHKNEKE